MLTKILRKRTRVEVEAWQAMRELMPRNRKTKGIQYEVLEYLFEHLYEMVPEEDLGQYLREVKGHLQRTGDPVKGAINQAVKELQRLPDHSFELIKIQESTLRGPRRLVKLNYTRFEDLINFDLYVDYLQDVLENEKDLMVRGISHICNGNPSLLFPGFTAENLDNCRAEFLIPPNTEVPKTKDVSYRFIPKSAANLHLLLVYECKQQAVPFLGFIARHYSRVSDPEFILYRGEEKHSILKFLDNIWQDLSAKALDEDQLEALRKEAGALAEKGGAEDERYAELILHGLVGRHCDKEPSANPLI